MLICPGCHAKMEDARAWMMCPECGFAFEDDDDQPTTPGQEAIHDEDLDSLEIDEDDNLAEPELPARAPARHTTPIPPSPLVNDLVYPTDMTADDLGEGADSGVEKVPVRPRHDVMLEEIRASIVHKQEPEALPLEFLEPAKEVLPPVVTPSPLSKKIRDSNIEPRAKKLVDAAEQDRARGDLASALTNLRLAVTFDPKSTLLKELLDEVSRETPKGGPRPGSKLNTPVQKGLVARAVDAEKAGDFDQAVRLLEKYVAGAPKDAAAANKLGILLANKKGELDRGRVFIEKAVALDPDNPSYALNLSKLLTHAATRDLKKKPESEKRPGSVFSGMFGKKK